MIKSLLAISFCAIFATACGGSSSSTPTTVDPVDGGPDPVNPTPTGPVGGQTGTFGDTATAANGRDANSTVCPASVTESFTGWALSGGSWCVWKCPANAVNNDGDDFGSIPGESFSCRDTSAALGSQVTTALFAPIAGCPAGGCNGAAEFFTRVHVSVAASSAELAKDTAYNCVPRLFDQNQQIWVTETTPAAFSLTLSADNSAIRDGTATTWSFANGTLMLEGAPSFDNVSVGSGSFSSWNSNTSLVRCQ